MPQLDKFSFFVQIFWFIFFFVISYIFLRYEILPSILYSLRLRQKSLDSLYENINNVIIETFIFNDFFKKFMSRKRILNIFDFYVIFELNINKYINKTVKEKIKG